MLAISVAVVVFALGQAAYLLRQREKHPVSATHAEVNGPRPLLTLIYRLAVLLHMCRISYLQIKRIGNWVFRFFTIWNWWLESLYFLLGALSAGLYLAQGSASSPKASAASPLLNKALVRIFSVSSAGSLLVAVTCWTVLYPMLRKSPDAAFIMPFLLSWSSANQHGLNAIFMLLDTALNRLPPDFKLAGPYLGLWEIVYVAWVFTHHFTDKSGRPIYPFLDLKSNLIGVSFVLLYAGHWLYVYLSYSLISAIRSFQGLSPEPHLHAKKRE